LLTRVRSKYDKHLPLIERRLGRTRVAFDEARVTKVREADLQRRAEPASVDVEEIVSLLTFQGVTLSDGSPHSFRLRMIEAIQNETDL